MKKSRLEDILQRNRKSPLRDLALGAVLVIGLALAALVVATAMPSVSPASKSSMAAESAQVSPDEVARGSELPPFPRVALR